MPALIWTPDPSVPLFRLPESATGPFSWSITAQVEVSEPAGAGGVGTAAVTIEAYSGAVRPGLGNLSISGGKDRLLVTAKTLSGLFPIVFIDYVAENDELERIYSWENLPHNARDLVEFRPDDQRLKTFTLTARAKLSSGDVEKAEYSLVVMHDWTSGRDRLIAEVDARRR
jgi:hypothetical protein